MTLRNPSKSMWADALTMLERADRLHRRFFQLSRSRNGGPTWEPPADIFEIDDALLILIALPGVLPDNVTVLIDSSALIVVGDRLMPAPVNTIIRSIEIPYGRFERRFDLPAGLFEIEEQNLSNGCLRLTLRKLA